MAKLYILTGPPASGKTTISYKLAETKEKSVVIEGDTIYNMVVGGRVSPWLEGNHLDLMWKTCIYLMKEYLKKGYDVIFNYIIMNDMLKQLKNEFKDIDTNFVVLISDSETMLKRDLEREEDCRMGERVLKLLEDFKKEPYQQYFLDTSKLTIEETIKKIEEKRFNVELGE